MSDINLFLEATRQALRFDSKAQVNLTTEQLWQLPLQSTRPNQGDLDSVGKILLRELREQEEESLITPANNAPKALAQLKLEVVKAIISHKQAENAAKVAELTRANEKAQLRQLLADKHAEEFKNMSKEEIEARLKELGG